MDSPNSRFRLFRVMSLQRPLVELRVAEPEVGMAATASFNQSRWQWCPEGIAEHLDAVA